MVCFLIFKDKIRSVKFPEELQTFLTEGTRRRSLGARRSRVADVGVLHYVVVISVWVLFVAGISGYLVGEAAWPDYMPEYGGRGGLAYRNHRRGHGYGVMGVMDAELRQSLNDRSEGRASAFLVQGVRPPRGCEDPVLRSVFKRNESVLRPGFEGRSPQQK